MASRPLNPGEQPAAKGPAGAPAAVPQRPSSWPVALRGLATGVTWAAILVSASLAFQFDLGIPRWLFFAVAGFMGFAFLSAGEGIVSLVWKLLGLLFARLKLERAGRILQTLPPVPIGRLLGAFIFIAGDLLWPDSFLRSLSLPVVGEIAIVLAGLTGMMVALARMDRHARPARAALIGLPAVLVLAFVVWVVHPGFDAYLAPSPETSAAPRLAVADPGLPGPHAVQSLSYGSGQSRHRPEFGEGADLITPVVDGSPVFGGYGGLIASYHEWYWGFDFSRLPLNGTVWYPAEAPGPLPLVLIVHGNHPMSRPSDPGYAYLGEHLAGRGYIAVSVDQNFLNGLLFFDGENAETPLRAWLLLQHLRLWRQWQETPGNPFAGRVDLERVALIGHSRGGEAVTWAAEMNWEDIPGLSDAADFGFGIRAVVAMAPSDAFTAPQDRKPVRNRASYLLLAAGHDADTYLLYGQRQYNRLRFDQNPDGFKALAYLYRGNHGQFNSVWGDRDRGLYNSWLLNRAPLLAQVEQQQAARLLITAFLEAALQEEAAYRDLFRNPLAAHEWLPETIIVTQIQDAALIPVEGGQDGTAGTHDLDLVRVETLMLRDGQTGQGNQALRLAWRAGSEPRYEIALRPGQAAAWDLTPDHALTFALAAVPGEPVPAGLVVELETAGGHRVQLPLSEFGPLLPPLPAYLVKAPWLAGLPGFPPAIEPAEVVLQTYTLPLAAFQDADPSFRPDALHTLRFRLAGDTAGALYLDAVGFAPALRAGP